MLFRDWLNSRVDWEKPFADGREKKYLLQRMLQHAPYYAICSFPKESDVPSSGENNLKPVQYQLVLVRVLIAILQMPFKEYGPPSVERAFTKPQRQCNAPTMY